MAKSHHDLGVRLGREYAREAYDDDQEAFCHYPAGAARDAFDADNPSGSREWYAMGFDRYREKSWEDFNDGFEAGVEQFVAEGCIR